MADELILKTNAMPTMWNKDALIGGLLGGWISPIIGTIAGAVIGGYFGKKQMEHEAVNGKRVGPPSLFNKESLIGGLVASIVAPIIGLLAVMAVGSMITLGTPAAAATLLAAGLAGSLGTIAVGTYIGGRAGMKRQTVEYIGASYQQPENTMSQFMGNGLEQIRAQEPSKNAPGEFVQKLERERALAASRQNDKSM